MGNDYSACSEHTSCPPGFGSTLELLIGSSDAHNYVSTCGPCAPGTYSAQDDFQPCIADNVTECDAGYKLVKADAITNATTG